MSLSLNRIQFIGNLGRDPELRYTPSGQAVCNFSVAVDDSYVNSDGEKVERTIWYRVAVWGKAAEACNSYLAKGRKVYVEGRLQHEEGSPRVYQKNDGGYAASFEVNASSVQFLSGRGEQAEEQPTETESIPF